MHKLVLLKWLLSSSTALSICLSFHMKYYHKMTLYNGLKWWNENTSYLWSMEQWYLLLFPSIPHRSSLYRIWKVILRNWTLLRNFVDLQSSNESHLYIFMKNYLIDLFVRNAMSWVFYPVLNHFLYNMHYHLFLYKIRLENLVIKISLIHY